MVWIGENRVVVVSDHASAVTWINLTYQYILGGRGEEVLGHQKVNKESTEEIKRKH